MSSPTGVDEAAERRRLTVLLLMVLATGVIDAACLLHLGVFTAYITGSLIVFAGELVGANTSAWPAATAVAAFLGGAVVGARVARREWPAHQLFAGGLVLVALLVATAAVVAATWGLDGGGSYATIAASGAAMGIQLAFIRWAGIADIALPAATLAAFNLVADSRAAGGTPERTVRRAGMVVAVLVGAVLGAGIAQWEPWAAWAAAAIIIAGAATAAYVEP